MEVFIAFAVITAAFWLIVSALGVIYPFRPFVTRKRAILSVFMTCTATVVLLVSLAPPQERLQRDGAPSIAQSQEETGSDDAEGAEHVLSASPAPASAVPAPCGNGGLSLGDVVAVSGETKVRKKPEANGDLIKNVKASNALGTTRYHQIDNSTTVRRICAQSTWSEVEIVTPEWLTHVRGWVPNEALKMIERTETGHRVFDAEDIYWDDDTSPYRAEIVSIVNRISQENSQCKEIDTYSIAKSGSRSKPGEPVFFATCNGGATAFNVWFSPEEADAAQGSFHAMQPIGRTAGSQACENYARSVATHPQTVSFSRVWDLAYQEYPSGRARLVSSFKAKNGFDLELKYRIDCLFEGATLLEATIAEASS